MPQSTKVGIVILVFIILVGGIGFFWYQQTKQGQQASSGVSSEQPTTGATAGAPSGAALSTGADNSNASLQQDAAQIDAGIAGVNKDNTQISQDIQ